MAKINLDYNLEDVSAEFEPLPTGQYLAKILNPEDFVLTESSTGKPMIKAVWSVTEGEYEGRKIYDNIVLTVPWKVKQYCDIAEVKSGQSLDTEDFIGLEGLIQVNQREYQGSIRNEVKTVQVAG